VEKHYSSDVGCLYVAEYVDEAPPPLNLAERVGPLPVAQAVLPRLVGDFFEQYDPEDRLEKYKVILKSDAQVVVFGHGLKPVVVGNDACVGVWRRSRGEEVLVALFPLGNTVGVFTGSVQVAS